MTTDLQRAIRSAAGELSGPSGDLASRLAARAAEEGLLDVAYASVDSPLGELTVAMTPAGLVRVAYSDYSGQEAVVEDLAERLSPRVLESPARLDPVRRELDEYFEGRRRDFDLPGTPIRLLLRSGDNPYAGRRKPNVTALDKHKPRRLEG